MQVAFIKDTALHYHLRAGTGTPVVFLNSLGTDFRIWDRVIDGLGISAPILTIDKRGHGLSDGGDISMDVLISDVATVMDQLDLGPALICGVSVGGMIAQGLAVTRPDLVAGLVLCCTGAKIGDAEGWNARIDAVQSSGIAPMSEAILERWFSPHFRANRRAELAGYRNMLSRTAPDGYAAVCGAIRDSDFTQTSSTIAVPTHCISGGDDLSTPPALVEALADLIPDATFEIIDQCAHLPCIETPEVVCYALRNLYAKLP
ncbi:MAG: 3-oxoadipate enol-lactonase [Sulfitobacter sp.]|jgi:3-oxoadipate enol-lactonase